MRFSLLGSMFLGLLVPAGAVAQGSLEVAPEVGVARLVSATAPPSQLDAASERVEDALRRHAAVGFDRTGTAVRLAEDLDVQRWRQEATESLARGQAALESLDMNAADVALNRATRAGVRAHLLYTAPENLAAMLEAQAQAAFTARRGDQLADTMRLLVWTHPTGELDPARFPPPVVTAFEDARSQARATNATPAPANAVALADLGRRARLRYVLGGHLRVDEAGRARVLLGLVAADGTVRRAEVGLDGDVLELTVRRLLEDAGAARAVVATNDLVPTPTPPNPGGDPAWYRRWYVWAAVGAVVAAGAATAGVASGLPSGGGGNEEPPPGTGIVFAPPGN